MNRIDSLVVTVFLAGLSLGASCQAPPGAITSNPGWPQPQVSDVDSVDHILGAVYDVISGPAHHPRDWDRFRSLFVPGARLEPIQVVPGTPDPKTAPATDVTFLAVDAYVARATTRMESEGFYERGVHNEIAQFGEMTSVFSTYESRHAASDQKPFARGINSIQLLKDGARYWIVQILWEAERPNLEIPAKYLAVSAGATDGITANFSGDWTGQLEYRDYQSDGRVFLPTWLSLRPGENAHQVSFAYTYDDGPTKVVREQLFLTLSPEAKTATITSADDHRSTLYQVTGFEEFAKKNRGKLVLTGAGVDNDKPAEIRITLTLYRNLLTWLKETRPAGSIAEFKFRDAYTMTRAAAPSL
jgi:hypothetical protein